MEKAKIEELIKIVNDFKEKKVGVIGDLMLDRFVFGDTERISPEAPVPVVLVENEKIVPGGAGNTANNISSFSSEVFVIGIVGEDREGDLLIKELEKRDINTNGVLRVGQKPTIQKTRIVARGQQIARLDKENLQEVDKEIENRIFGFVTSQIKKWDILVISDYEKGLITPALAEKLVSLANSFRKMVVVDPRPKNALFFKNATILTPNQKEALEIAGVLEVEKAGRVLQEKLNSYILITQGAEGMTLFEKDKVKHFPAKTREVFDVGGAGDTVVAVLSLALACGASFEDASLLANHAAGIVVRKIGTATATTEELINDLENNG